MRVIGGSLRGRVFQAPSGVITRPTADRVREALFNMLGASPEGVRVLDLFAGSGSLGFEALSRGASGCTFVESDRSVMRVIQKNAQHLGVQGLCQFVLGDATDIVARHHRLLGDSSAYQLVFMDPPYQFGFPLELIRQLSQWSGLKSPALLVVEMSRQTGAQTEEDDSPMQYVEVVRKRTYGDTAVAILRYERDQ